MTTQIHTLGAGSGKAMLAQLGLKLWKAGRFDPGILPEARGKPVESEDKAMTVMMRSSTADVGSALAGSMNGDKVVIQGRVDPRSMRSLQRLGVPVEVERSEAEANEPRYIDMTMMVVVFAALIMGVRYLALGMGNRMLYVMAGLGYALFFIVRSFSFQWKRPRSKT